MLWQEVLEGELVTLGPERWAEVIFLRAALYVDQLFPVPGEKQAEGPQSQLLQGQLVPMLSQDHDH